MSMYMFKGVSVCVEGLWGCVHVEGVYVYLCFYLFRWVCTRSRVLCVQVLRCLCTVFL